MVSMRNEHKQNRIAEVISLARQDSGAAKDHGYAGFAAFVQHYFESATPYELENYDSHTLFQIALSFWKFSAVRKSGEVLLRVFNPSLDGHGWSSPNSVLQVVCDDMPFLVDSVLGELNAQDLTLHAVLHPIVHIRRDADGVRQGTASARSEVDEGAVRESMIHVEFTHHSDRNVLESIRTKIEHVIDHVRIVVADFEAMCQRMDEAIDGLRSAPLLLDREELDECLAFLYWLKDNHFAFLGSRIYRFDGEPETGDLLPLNETGLGLLRDPENRVLRRGRKSVNLTPEVREFLMLPAPIIITKANVRSDVHRRVYMDYIGIKLYDDNGQLSGECRFVGLFTAEAYNLSAARIPLLSRKVRNVLTRSGFDPDSYNYKALNNILENYPRDELFQVSEEMLLRTALGILDLTARPRTRLFVRHDRYDRYISALVFVPRDRYDSRVREKIADILVKAYNGRLSAYYPHFNDTSLARVHFIIGLDPEEDRVLPDERELEETIVKVTRNWADGLKAALIEKYGEEKSRPLFARYASAFQAGYQDDNDGHEGVRDIEILEPLGPLPAIAVRCYRRAGDDPATARFRLYRAEEPVPLSHVLPILENMGFKVIRESGYCVNRGDATFWIHDFLMRQARGLALDFDQGRIKLEEAFTAAWFGHVENDRFNRLSVEQGLNWRTVALLRAFAHYRRQTGRALSMRYMQDTLANHPQITALLVELFHVRFDPSLGLSLEQRAARQGAIREDIIKALGDVKSLDEDNIIRQFLNLIESLWRTNFFQTDEAGRRKPYISFKISSRDIDDLPLPRPLTEIFVYSPRVEGVHLRWGLVARGGLRWSDRREDFRTEVLGLAKAQQVKNAVIVPVGAKGGFVPKLLMRCQGREEIQKEGVACYRLFVSGLLDLADNIVAGKVVKPEDTLVHDGDDPYLVVAADKGTATFSDIANEISARYGLWLGDAFASGGSQGYDHKKMGITARGAWEAVKRHFRELGRDIQSEPFTVVGVGDMSGDVFGNGMLLSRRTRLIAAFDHRDIFLDPDPDPETSYAERERLFHLPRSSWADYNKDLISPGGGVFSRSLKSIPLTDQIRAALDIEADHLTPNELIRAILKAPADLLWFGGIGTYVKSADQRHAEVGDKTNDAVRVDADDLRVQVIGEGANLGVTQAGRIAFARKGGRINTDAIDNSAGVDCSDHEVNIKILLSAAQSEGLLTTEERNHLLEEMTDNVSALVLRNNYDQTLALSLMLAEAADDLDSYKRFMQTLERQDALNRQVEGLPSDEQLEELMIEGQGLTRPELAVLMAYAKITLFDSIVRSDIPDTDDMIEDIRDYFPQQIKEKFPQHIERHQLRREIIATVVASQVVNNGGITFVNRLVEDTGAPESMVVKGFIVTEGAYGLRDLRARINALDNRVPADVQTRMHLELVALLRRQVLWFLRYDLATAEGENELSLSQTIRHYAEGLKAIRACLDSCLSPYVSEHVERKVQAFAREGVDGALARDVALLEPLTAACDIVDVAQLAAVDIGVVTRIYFALGNLLGLDRLRDLAYGLRLSEHWERLAVRRIIDDLYHQQRVLTDAVLLDVTPECEVAQILDHWVDEHRAAVERASALLAEMAVGGALSVAKLSLAGSQVRELATLAAAKRRSAASVAT